MVATDRTMAYQRADGCVDIKPLHNQGINVPLLTTDELRKLMYLYEKLTYGYSEDEDNRCEDGVFNGKEKQRD